MLFILGPIRQLIISVWRNQGGQWLSPLSSRRFGSVAGLSTSVALPSFSATVYRHFISVFSTQNTANPSRFGGINSVNGSILYQVFGLPQFDSLGLIRLRLQLLWLRSIGKNYLAHS